MAGENCTLAVTSYGARSVKCDGIGYGMDVVAGAPDSARNYRAFYISKVATNRFYLNLVFVKFADYDAFVRWVEEYGKQASTPGTPVGAMRVTIPARRFDRVGVPVTGITFGDLVRKTSYRLTVIFDGARDLGDTTVPKPSTFSLPANDKTDAPYFYPAGVQSSAAVSSVEDQLYNALDQPLDTFNAGNNVRVQ